MIFELVSADPPGSLDVSVYHAILCVVAHRARRDGWTAEQTRRTLECLGLTGSPRSSQMTAKCATCGNELSFVQIGTFKRVCSPCERKRAKAKKLEGNKKDEDHQ